MTDGKLIHYVGVQVGKVRDDKLVIEQVFNHLFGDRARGGDFVRHVNVEAEFVKGRAYDRID